MEKKKLLFKNTWKLDFQNIVGLSIVVLAIALQAWALFKGLTCPYCLKQRIALFIVGVGFLVKNYSTDNRFEIARKTIMLGSSIWGAIIAFAQLGAIFTHRMDMITKYSEMFFRLNTEEQDLIAFFIYDSRKITWIANELSFLSMLMFFALVLYSIFSYAYKWDVLVKFLKNFKFAYAAVLAVTLVLVGSVEAKQVTKEEADAAMNRIIAAGKNNKDPEVRKYLDNIAKAEAKVERIKREQKANQIRHRKLEKLDAVLKRTDDWTSLISDKMFDRIVDFASNLNYNGKPLGSYGAANALVNYKNMRDQILGFFFKENEENMCEFSDDVFRDKKVRR